MKTVAILAAAAAAAIATTPAQAISFVFTPAGAGTVAPGFTVLNDFNAGTGLTGTGFTYHAGNVSGLAAMPAGSDGSRYAAVQNGGSATAMLGQGITAFSLYIGSVDASNRIIFNYADGSSDAIFGTALTIPHDGNQVSPQNNGLFRFTGTDGKAISSLTFTSGQNSFEFDDLAVQAGAVPEPATWAMLVLGFGLVGSAARRRRSTLAMASA